MICGMKKTIIKTDDRFNKGTITGNFLEDTNVLTIYEDFD